VLLGLSLARTFVARSFQATRNNSSDPEGRLSHRGFALVDVIFLRDFQRSRGSTRSYLHTRKSVASTEADFVPPLPGDLWLRSRAPAERMFDARWQRASIYAVARRLWMSRTAKGVHLSEAASDEIVTGVLFADESVPICTRQIDARGRRW